VKYQTLIAISLLVLAASCQTTSSDSIVKQNDSDSILIEGKRIAQLTGSSLKAELKQALQTGGIQNAIGYCNVHALSLTDSIAQNQGVKVQRLAKRNRNPKNSLDSLSLEVFNKMERQVLSSERPGAIVLSQQDHMVFYAPIRLEGACLACHGTTEQIGEENLAVIKENYPEDLAINFKPGELRGLWKITL